MRNETGDEGGGIAQMTRDCVKYEGMRVCHFAPPGQWADNGFSQLPKSFLVATLWMSRSEHFKVERTGYPKRGRLKISKYFPRKYRHGYLLGKVSDPVFLFIPRLSNRAFCAVVGAPGETTVGSLSLSHAARAMRHSPEQLPVSFSIRCAMPLR